MVTKTISGKKSAAVKKVATKKTATPAKRAPASSTKKAVAKTPAAKSKAAPAVKKDKPQKIKMVRDSYSMPESDYANLIDLKKKCLAAGVHVKKSELLRVGLMSIAKLSNASLLAAVKQVAAKK